MELGEDVRQSDWFKEFTEDLIANYVKFKETGKDGDFLRGEIFFSYRRGAIIQPFRIFSNKKDLKEISVPMEE